MTGTTPVFPCLWLLKQEGKENSRRVSLWEHLIEQYHDSTIRAIRDIMSAGLVVLIEPREVQSYQALGPANPINPLWCGVALSPAMR
ncbi:MAG: hypothetical protein A2Z42_04835 [Candidatus Woykebacteria bacterium RBG_19FT_COMBO_43_10]|uniref:Uncharacterized protein n=1 Tax=Candidatus Woykebacteria bacterium RBG_19FT_COMBO_43_10 TaxID=1802598 RepID=A0A1G1WFT8_9BACT|nr:MAG: hypothetical protein A2Z42_04835 [Candidatus Woykebacteria bacterium RBG_19FT_COMBO_43_10]